MWNWLYGLYFDWLFWKGYDLQLYDFAKQVAYRQQHNDSNILLSPQLVKNAQSSDAGNDKNTKSADKKSNNISRPRTMYRLEHGYNIMVMNWWSFT